MPGDDEKRMFYSFNLGPVHFVSISTEYYYFVEYGTQQMVNQYFWLEQDLAQVSWYVKCSVLLIQTQIHPDLYHLPKSISNVMGPDPGW